MIPLRDYQRDAVDGIHAAWAEGAAATVAVLPTGAGKTVVFSSILARHDGAAVAIAHRQELVGQMSMALARCNVPHRIIAPPPVIKRIVLQHMAELGSSSYHPSAAVAVAGVDTLINRTEELARWLPTVGLWVIDEAHHLLTKNKWGTATTLFPNARGLGVTATPCRADGKGLGTHADGLFDSMVEGPTMRQLIDDGWLTDYRIFAPQSDVDLSTVDVTATGDYSPAKLKAAVRESHIVGDVVRHYLKIAPGLLGVCFASDVETATTLSNRFNEAGVPSEVVSAKTADNVRAAIMKRYRKRELMMLVNVDLFGEGFDLPCLEVCIMARPTQSFALFVQQFGRPLRLALDGPTPDTRSGRLAAIAASNKPRAIIIDHVGNVVRHGLPDAARDWSLDARGKRTRDKPDDGIPLRACLNVECMQIYERVLPECPYCGSKPVPANRSAPEFVDGDLTELDAATLAAMRGYVAKIDQDAEEYRADLINNRCPAIGVGANVKRHKASQEAQTTLRSSMAWWAGLHTARGRTDAEAYRRFYHAFGIDALSAQALTRTDALALAERIAVDGFGISR